MTKHYKTTLSLFFIFSFITSSPFAATVETKYGVREGTVISRMFDEIVVTIITPQKKIFQFPASDIVKITAKDKVLIAEVTALFEKDAANSEKISDIVPGTEIEVLEAPSKSDWIKVKGWGSTEGWLLKKVLTNEVVFSKDVIKVISPREPKNESPVSVPIMEPSLLPAGTTVEASTVPIKKATKTK